MSFPKADDSVPVSSTPCTICQNLEPPWPIEIRYYRELINWNHRSSCKGCELLRIVLGPYASDFEPRLSRDLVTVECMDGKMYVKTWLYTLVIYADEGMFFPRSVVDGETDQYGNVQDRGTLSLAVCTSVPREIWS
jgi:hypothetical protein